MARSRTAAVVAPMKFRARLVRPEGVGTWTFAPIPAKVSAEHGLRAHQRVKGTIDGRPFGSTLMPRGGGIFFLVVARPLREELGKSAGDEVEVAIELDTAPTRVRVPPALAKVLRADGAAWKEFQALAPSHRKAFARWIDDAKQEETRQRRVARALDMIRRHETLN